MNNKYYLGLDIGGTKCAVIAGTEKMELLGKTSFPTDTHLGPGHAINRLIEASEEMITKFDHSGLQSVGISCGGPLDSKKGLIQSPPNLPGWDNIPIVSMLNEKFRVPVYLQNDANACALAEWRFGAGKGTENMIFLTFGTGMGAGLILNGRLYSGTNDLAGEVGHIRLADDGPEAYGKKGSFEGFCSGTGIAHLAGDILKRKLLAGETISFCKTLDEADHITAREVAEAAFMGDKTAIEIFEISGTWLGKGLSILIDILNPEVIVIGSIYARCRKFLEPACMKIINSEALEPARRVCKILPAELGEKVGDYASLCVAVTGNG
ncbi:MAG: ROK family protein [Bacteroidales bacterium]|nr:ROK family protein [Bacteroidales bacterium]